MLASVQYMEDTMKQNGKWFGRGAHTPQPGDVIFFRWPDGGRHVGSAELFRLEEYKLPEFKVAVKTPVDEDGKKKSFLLGEKVEVEIQSDYYFGGPVANANVEVIVRQNNYYRWWHQPWDFPWFYRDFNPYQNYWRGGGGGDSQKASATTGHNRSRHARRR